MKWIIFQVQVPVFARKWHNSHAGGKYHRLLYTHMCVYLSVLVHKSQDGGCLGSVALAGIIYSDSPWGEHH